MTTFTNERVLSLLSQSSDEHILAGLTILSKMEKDLPPPQAIVDALSTRGTKFISRLIETGVKNSSKAGYIDLALSMYRLLVPTLTLSPEAIGALLKVLNLSSSEDTSRRESAVDVFALLPSSESMPEVMAGIVSAVEGTERAKAVSVSTEEWEGKNLSGLLKKCEDFVRDRSSPSLHSKYLIQFMNSSTNLDLSLKILNATLEIGKEAQLMEKFSFNLPSVCGKLIVTGLRLDAIDKVGTETPRDVSLLLLGRLLDTCGAKWIIDHGADNNPIKISVRVACGELRINLAEVLELAEAEPGTEVDERLLVRLDEERSDEITTLAES